MPTNPFDPAQIEAALGARYSVGNVLCVGGQGTVFRATRIKTEDGQPASDEVALIRSRSRAYPTDFLGSQEIAKGYIRG